MFEFNARRTHSPTVVGNAIAYIRVADLSRRHPTAQDINATRVGDTASNNLVP